MRRPCKFTETDLRRAIRAARKEGLLPHVGIMPDGRIAMTPITEMAAAHIVGATGPNEWDAAS